MKPRLLHKDHVSFFRTHDVGLLLFKKLCPMGTFLLYHPQPPRISKIKLKRKRNYNSMPIFYSFLNKQWDLISSCYNLFFFTNMTFWVKYFSLTLTFLTCSLKLLEKSWCDLLFFHCVSFPIAFITISHIICVICTTASAVWAYLKYVCYILPIVLSNKRVSPFHYIYLLN